MDLKQEIVAALQSGSDHHALMEIVYRHCQRGLTDREAYVALEAVWRDLGFQDSDAESAQRDELEFVMERVWYFGATASQRTA